VAIILQLSRFAAHNRVLATLSVSDERLLRPDLEEVLLPKGSALHEGEGEEEQVYFPRRGAVSLIAELPGGSAVGLAMIGREGVINALAACPELPQSLLKPVVVIELGAFRIRASRLVEILPNAESLRRALKADAERLTSQVQRSADCNASHPIEARLVGLLLRVADCIGGHRIPLTPDEMSQMLGVRETTVALALGLMVNDGVLYRPGDGHVEITDFASLEKAACGCHARTRELHLGGSQFSTRETAWHGKILHDDRCGRNGPAR
jgi:CRP-like cAMP-binding protein